MKYPYEPGSIYSDDNCFTRSFDRENTPQKERERESPNSSIFPRNIVFFFPNLYLLMMFSIVYCNKFPLYLVPLSLIDVSNDLSCANIQLGATSKTYHETKDTWRERYGLL
jgi:hypothetical protein